MRFGGGVGMCTGALGFRCNRVWMNWEGVGCTEGGEHTDQSKK